MNCCVLARETSLWDAEITQLKDRYRLNGQQLDAKFILKKQLMMVRQAKVRTLVFLELTFFIIL